MSDTQVKLLRAGVREVMRSPSMQVMLQGLGHEIVLATGKPYRVTVRPGVNRAHARVSTATREQYLDEIRNPTLVGATRGAKPTGKARSKAALERFKAGQRVRKRKSALAAAKRRRTRVIKRAVGVRGAADVLKAGLEVRQAQRAHRRALKAHQKTRKGS